MIIYYINFLICHFLYYHKMKKYSTLLCKVFFLFIIFRYNSQFVIKCLSIVCLNFMFPAPNIVQTVKTSPTFRLTVCKLVGPHLKASIQIKITGSFLTGFILILSIKIKFILNYVEKCRNLAYDFA